MDCFAPTRRFFKAACVSELYRSLMTTSPGRCFRAVSAVALVSESGGASAGRTSEALIVDKELFDVTNALSVEALSTLAQSKRRPVTDDQREAFFISGPERCEGQD